MREDTISILLQWVLILLLVGLGLVRVYLAVVQLRLGDLDVFKIPVVVLLVCVLLWFVVLGLLCEVGCNGLSMLLCNIYYASGLAMVSYLRDNVCEQLMFEHTYSLLLLKEAYKSNYG